MATARMIIVRHGERLDEAPGATEEWDAHCRRQGSHPDRYCDPPITAAGRAQAEACAAAVRDHVLDQLAHASSESPLTVWCSPLLRCLQTADSILQQLTKVHGVPHDAVRLIPVPGLAECSAAVRRVGLARFRFLDESEVQAACTSPVSSPALVPTVDCGHDFDNTVKALAKAHTGGAFLVVSHREGIRDLKLSLGDALSHREAQRTPGYCALAIFDYHTNEDRWSFVSQQELREARAASDSYTTQS